MGVTEGAAAERALEHRAGLAAFDAAKSGPVSLADAGAIFDMDGEIRVLLAADVPRADLFVVLDAAGVGFTEAATAELAHS